MVRVRLTPMPPVVGPEVADLPLLLGRAFVAGRQTLRSTGCQPGRPGAVMHGRRGRAAAEQGMLRTGRSHPTSNAV